MRRRIRQRIVLCALCLTAVGSLLHGDVLVTTDGSVIETDGEWRQKGRTIVFTRAGGGLESIRADDIDFEATERLRSAPEAAPEPEPEAAPAKARIVLTDADIARAPTVLEPAPVAGDDGGGDGTSTDAEGDGEAAGDEAQASASVRVIAWEDDEPADGEGRRLYGTLRNDGNAFASGVTLSISVFDDAGNPVGSQQVEPQSSSLRPGESTTFSAQFREAFAIGAAKITVSSVDLEVGLGGAERDPDEFAPDELPPDGR